MGAGSVRDLGALLREDEGGVVFRVRVAPRASANSISSLAGGVIRIRINAPPAEGRANQALLKYLGEIFGVPLRRLSILRGQSSREKTVRVEGLSAADVAERFLREMRS
ncbi:MAG: DUF167 domain-containing protein [Firmicutes bacterium]|nr:DUF167 domain-containing protein [Bacillota bacterium]